MRGRNVCINLRFRGKREDSAYIHRIIGYIFGYPVLPFATLATRLGYSILCLIVMQVRLCAIDPKSHSELNPELIL
jgi:hypothetical protein